MTTGSLLDAHVRGYAQAVRLHLADLGPEVVEDLADGLEADLADAVADRLGAAAGRDEAPGSAPAHDVALDLVAVFGPAAQYADELRVAAGLPPAVPDGGRRRGRARAATSARGRALRDAWSRAWAPVTSTPAWAGARAAMADLRPVWWVGRGWVLGSWAAVLFGSDRFSLVPVETVDLVVQVLAVAVSVQWGRGRWMPWRWMPRFVTVASVVAVVVALPLSTVTRAQVAYGLSYQRTGGSYSAGYAQGVQDGSARNVAFGGIGSPSGDDGVWVDGMQVSNLFAYDANGDPLRDVQLFDDRGRPVRTVPAGSEREEWAVPDVTVPQVFRPALATDGRERWNAYPLRSFATTDMVDDDDTLRPAVGARPQPVAWPFLKAPTAIDSDDAQETPGAPTDGASPAPSGGPEPTATPTTRPSSGGAPQAPAGTTTAASR